MIKYDNKNWFSFLIRHGGKHVEGMWWSMLIMTILTAILIFLEENYHWMDMDFPDTFFKVIGIVLGLLLVFRTNTAYDRWWEGRKQLGALVNTTRNLAIKVNTYVPEKDYPEKELILDLIVALTYTIKEHLRKGEFEKIIEEIPREVLSKYNRMEHKPNYILAEIARHIQQLYKQDIIDGEQLIVLEKEANTLINILGACERIRNTPIPMAYALHLKRIVFVYSLALPFAFVKTMHWWSIPLVLIMFYTMVGIELIGEEIEDPFGLDENDLPVDELSDKIKANINEIKSHAKS
ncbi:MAG: bestrophin family protein [Chitinophagales bacterium]